MPILGPGILPIHPMHPGYPTHHTGISLVHLRLRRANCEVGQGEITLHICLTLHPPCQKIINVWYENIYILHICKCNIVITCTYKILFPAENVSVCLNLGFRHCLWRKKLSFLVTMSVCVYVNQYQWLNHLSDIMVFSLRVLHKKLLNKSECCVGSVTVTLYLTL
jgi:hypothetical protein